MAQQGRFTLPFGTLRLIRDATLGTGAYGQVCKATIDGLPCAAKLLHPVLVDPNSPRNRTRFEQECRFLSEIRHPNIVQYLGVAQDEETGLPVLLMELMDDSLTHLLDQSENPLAYHVQVNISHDIALAVAFLHLNCIVHRDLSSNNVLVIGAGSRAKVTDFGMSKLTEMNSYKAGLTKCPGTPAYMAPEALLDPPVYTEKLDCFQVGVLMIQTITRKFPDPGPAMNRVRDTRFPTGWFITPIQEVERRQNHLSLVSQTHPLLCIAVDCLKDTDSERPSAQQICRYLSALKEASQYSQSLESGERERGKEREKLIQQLRQENQEREKDFQHQLQQKEKEVMDKEGEIKKLLCQLQKMELELREKNYSIHQLQQAKQSAPSYTCLVSGPGLHSVTANHPTHVIVEVNDSSGRPCSQKQNITAELVPQSTSQATFTSGGWSKETMPRSHQPPAINATVAILFPSQYMVSYTAVRRGQHKLHVQVDCTEVKGSPFTLTVNPDPIQLCSPVWLLTNINKPYGIAINSRGEMVVTEWGGHQVSVFDPRGQKVKTFGSRDAKSEKMKYPSGIAVDDMDNIYVTSEHKLQKFTSSGELMNCVGRRGSKEGEFNDPRGVTIHKNQVYVCDRDNHRIQVFDLGLKSIQSIGSHGKERGEFDRPLDGNVYIAEIGNKRVQVMDRSGHSFRVFGEKGEEKLSGLIAIHIADKYVYVCDLGQHCFAVYQTSGQFVISFGRRGNREGGFCAPFCITSCANGFLYVCDGGNDRIQIF